MPTVADSPTFHLVKRNEHSARCCSTGGGAGKGRENGLVALVRRSKMVHRHGRHTKAPVVVNRCFGASAARLDPTGVQRPAPPAAAAGRSGGESAGSGVVAHPALQVELALEVGIV